MVGNEVQKYIYIIQKECPLVAVMGTPANGCDMTPDLKSRFQTLHHASKKSRRAVEWRWTKGRDGGPGPCSGRGPGDRGRPGLPGQGQQSRRPGQGFKDEPVRLRPNKKQTGTPAGD